APHPRAAAAAAWKARWTMPPAMVRRRLRPRYPVPIRRRRPRNLEASPDRPRGTVDGPRGRAPPAGPLPFRQGRSRVALLKFTLGRDGTVADLQAALAREARQLF